MESIIDELKAKTDNKKCLSYEDRRRANNLITDIKLSINKISQEQSHILNQLEEVKKIIDKD